MKPEPVESPLSPALRAWLRNFSQSAAIDMSEGGDDKECVAEVCLTCIDIHDRKLAAEVVHLVKTIGHDALLDFAAAEVCTL